MRFALRWGFCPFFEVIEPFKNSPAMSTARMEALEMPRRAPFKGRELTLSVGRPTSLAISIGKIDDSIIQSIGIGGALL